MCYYRMEDGRCGGDIMITSYHHHSSCPAYGIIPSSSSTAPAKSSLSSTSTSASAPPMSTDTKKQTTTTSSFREEKAFLATSSTDTTVGGLAHLVYKVDFHNTQHSSLWTSVRSEQDALNAIYRAVSHQTNKQSNKKGRTSHFSNQQDNDHNMHSESKIIVVLELPSGGAVNRFYIDKSNDDVLHLDIMKHSLMLNPDAIAFAGIKSNIFDKSTDGPNTHRGCVRLNECAKALHAFKRKMELSNASSKSNIVTVSINLPEPVSREHIKHFFLLLQQVQPCTTSICNCIL